MSNFHSHTPIRPRVVGAMAGIKRAVEDTAPVVSKKARFEVGSPTDKTTPSSHTSQPFTDTASIADTSATSRSASNRPKKYECEYEGCHKAFDRPVRLEAHIRSHTGERPFACEEPGCTKRFFKAEHLKAHTQNKHSDYFDHVCTYVLYTSKEGEPVTCGKAFPTSSKLKTHYAQHERKEELKCDECGQTFRKAETLQRHIRKEHLKEKEFVCMHTTVQRGLNGEQTEEMCGKEFPSATQFKTHVNRDHIGKRHFCEICTPPTNRDNTKPDDDDAVMAEMDRVSFPSYAELQAHKKEAHPPTCITCGKVCVSKSDLTAHMDIQHGSSVSDRKQRFPCTFEGCERSFTRQGNLNVHVKSAHGKTKSFVCGQFDLTGNDKVPGWNASMGCGQAFAAKATLEGHVRTQHLDLPILRKDKPQQKKKTKKSNIKSEDGASLAVGMEVDEANMAPSDLAGSESAALSLLTGHGYAEQRPLACWNSGCTFRFMRDFDLAQHMEIEHGWNVDDINERLAEEAALEGEKFWIGGDVEDHDDVPQQDETEELLLRCFAQRLSVHHTANTQSEVLKGNGMKGPVEGGEGDIAVDPALLAM